MSSSTSSPATENNEKDEVSETIEITIPGQKVSPIPLFLKKLWKMVNDSNNKQVIEWNSTGDGFVIYDQLKFVTELLPQYFKHNNLSSFIRQLNFYDFHKVANIDKNEMEFAHSCFLRDLPETLSFITRKVPNIKARTNHQVLHQENVTELFNGVRELKTQHNLIDNELKMLKQENAALWNEINSLRLKYSKQTKIINKLIHFLISYMHSHQTSYGKTNITVNRKSDQKHLKTTPQLLQIDYCKKPKVNSEKETHLKIPGPSKIVKITIPDNIRSTSKKIILQPGVVSSNSLKPAVEKTLKKYPVTSVTSYPVVTNVDPCVLYKVTCPDNQQEPSEYLNSDYPIEEIVTEVDPNIEESSEYIVKFPSNDSKEDHKNQILDIISQLKHPIKEEKSISSLKKDGKIKCDKRKGGDILPTLSHKPKVAKIILNKEIPQQPSNSSRKCTQQSEHKVLKDSKTVKQLKQVEGSKNKKGSKRNVKQDNMIPEPSPIKPEVILEDLFSEIGNPCTEEPVSEILSNLAQESVNSNHELNHQLPEMIFENQDEDFPVQNQSEVISTTENIQDIEHLPGQFFSDSANQNVPNSSAEDVILTSFSGDQDATDFTNESLLDDELKEYNEEMLSSLPIDMQQVDSPSKQLLKYNIIENPKENLGVYLDNTQLQLDNIQDLLNELNSGEFVDLWNCFNATNEDDEIEQKPNIVLGQNKLRNN